LLDVSCDPLPPAHGPVERLGNTGRRGIRHQENAVTNAKVGSAAERNALIHFLPGPDRHLNYVARRPGRVRRVAAGAKRSTDNVGSRLQGYRLKPPQEGDVERLNRNVRLVERGQNV